MLLYILDSFTFDASKVTKTFVFLICHPWHTGKHCDLHVASHVI